MRACFRLRVVEWVGRRIELMRTNAIGGKSLEVKEDSNEFDGEGKKTERR